MKLGMHLPQMGPHANRKENLVYAQRVEALGYDSLWASDHVVVPYHIASSYPGSADGVFSVPPRTDFLEPLILLSAVAACTERVELGLSVLVIPHRQAVLAAKMLASLDQLSAGRLLIGTGVGWMEEELLALNASYRQRGAMTDAYLEAMIKLWTEEQPDYTSAFVNFPAMGCYPKPARQPHPPLLIGGHSPAAFRRVARFGQGWHATSVPPARLAMQLQAIHQEMRQIGRDPATLDVSIRLTMELTREPQPAPRRPLQGDAQQLIDDIRAYEQVGVHHIALFFPMGRRIEPLDTIERFAEQVLPAFRESSCSP